MKISDFGNLRKALETFDRNGKYAQRGSWSIGRGGYDLWFEIYYGRTPIVGCTAGELERYNSDEVSAEDYEKICNIIHEVYPDIALPKLWAYRITYVGDGIKYYCEPGDVIESTESDEIFYSEAEAFSAATLDIRYSWHCPRGDCKIEIFEVNI